MANNNVLVGTNQNLPSSDGSSWWKPLLKAFTTTVASTAGACLIKIGYDWVKRKWIDTPGKIAEDNVLTENNIKETNARKEAKEELLKTQSIIKIEEEAQLSDLRLREFEQKKRIEFEYAQKMAKVKQSASSKDNDTPQPAPDWVPPCSYDKMRADTDIQTSPIVPGFIEEGQINFLVGGAGVAKSMLMRQLALAVDTGGKIGILPDFTVAKRAVLFSRLEEFAHEEQGKYGRGEIFANSGIMWRTKSDFKDFTQHGIINDLTQLALRIENDMVVFIDPITKPSDYNAEKFIIGAEQAINNAKKRGHTLTIVVSAHLEELEPWKPTTSVNIQGGDALIRKAGSVTAICRERTSKDHRFLKCLKAPKGYPEPDDVIVCKIERQEIDEHNWNTQMSYVCRKKEEEALPLKPKATIDDDAEHTHHPMSKGDEMLMKALNAEKTKREKGLTDEELATKFHVSRQTISNWRKFLEEWRKTHQNGIEGV